MMWLYLNKSRTKDTFLGEEAALLVKYKMNKTFGKLPEKELNGRKESKIGPATTRHSAAWAVQPL